MVKRLDLLTVPVLSREHIQTDTFLTLEHLHPRPVVAVFSDHSGVFVAVEHAKAASADRPDLAAVLAWAKTRGYAWICLHETGAHVEGLAVHPWM